MSKPNDPNGAGNDFIPTDPPAPPAFKDYSAETVAGVAVHLLANNTPTGAAKEAIKLLDACRSELATRAKHTEIFSRARTERREWWNNTISRG